MNIGATAPSSISTVESSNSCTVYIPKQIPDGASCPIVANDIKTVVSVVNQQINSINRDIKNIFGFNIF